VRFQSVDRLLSEIEEGLKVFPSAKEIFFIDDTIINNKEWFEKFALEYKERIGLPYYGHARFEDVNDGVARLLKDSGCKLLYLGVENGDELLRKKILRRAISNERIEEASNILKKFDIKQLFLNIIGTPGETMETMLSTVRLNARLKPSRILKSYFYPLKGTDAYKICKERGYLTNAEVTTLQQTPTVNLDTVSHNQMIFVFRYFEQLCRLSNSRFLECILAYKFFPYAGFNRLHQIPKEVLNWIRVHPFIHRILKRMRYSKDRFEEVA